MSTRLRYVAVIKQETYRSIAGTGLRKAGMSGIRARDDVDKTSQIRPLFSLIKLVQDMKNPAVKGKMGNKQT